MLRWGLLSLAALAAMLVVACNGKKTGENDLLIIAHRGASGERPEHTLASYELAIEQGADYIEPDLVITNDKVLIARHENEISETTDVEDRPEFADRRTTKLIDGHEFEGWFVEDFTLAELKTLRAKERLPELRAANTEYDGQFEVPTFAEILELVAAKEKEIGRRIGIYPELKHPTFLLEKGLDGAELLVAQLKEAGYSEGGDPVFLQCFEVGTLERLDAMIDLPLIQLMGADGGPADKPQITYAEMITPAGLEEIAKYSDGIGVDLRLVLTEGGQPTSLVGDAKTAGLDVHGWTLRKENAFLPEALRSSDVDAEVGDLAALWAMLEAAGIDGVFTDDPALAINARDGK